MASKSKGEFIQLTTQEASSRQRMSRIPQSGASALLTSEQWFAATEAATKHLEQASYLGSMTNFL